MDNPTIEESSVNKVRKIGASYNAVKTLYDNFREDEVPVLATSE